MSTVETPAARTAVDIPDGWRELGWPALRSLASKLTDEPVRDKDDAVRAIMAEFQRRAMRVPAIEAPPRVIPTVEIPPDWHETMSVAQIIDLARQIEPAGNPVEVIRAELARRSSITPAKGA